ncbi:MAG: hypothetical protein H8Z69_01580 [Nanohaloarchaea archaeon]|nr:hypothetical protein [Candidatus Nanohaloarchaea archaeon]
MTDDDYGDILDNDVEDVKQSIRDLKNPDYGKLLDLEKEGKDRKTIKDFLESKATDTEEPEELDEVAEEIEEETSNGLLGSYSPEAVLAGGAIIGIVIGLIGGLGAASMTDSGSMQDARNSLNELLEVTGSEAEVVDMKEVSGVYQATVNVSQVNPRTNQTEEVSQPYFVSKDGKYLFQGAPIDQQIQRAKQIQQMRQRMANGTANTTAP